jgi:hypothetical protein
MTPLSSVSSSPSRGMLSRPEATTLSTKAHLAVIANHTKVVILPKTLSGTI